MLDWLIVGGGVHGTHLAHVLLRRGADRARIAVLDPHDGFLARWRECTRAVGMRHLRSPAVHHLGLDPFDLHRFARDWPEPRPFVAPYDRPSLPMFDAHCDEIVASLQLDSIRRRGAARRLRRAADGFRVETDVGVLDSRRVVLALGLGDQRAWPGWALHAQLRGARIEHVFDPGFRRATVAPGTTLVVGGGISAGQLASALAADGRQVALWMRHPLRIHQFDSDPGWIGPRYMDGFRREGRVDRRRALIREARHRGSMPLDVADDLGAHIKAGRVRIVGGAFASADAVGDGGLVLRTSTETVGVTHTVLCTGFDAARPGGDFLDDAIDALGLRCAACGYPVPDRRLEWAPGLFVMGPLAELELGPTARNITGARAGAERIAA